MENNSTERKIAVLGSTGSVGRQALAVAEDGKYKIDFLTGGKNLKLLAEQTRKFGVRKVAVADVASVPELKLLLAGENVSVTGGETAICELISNSDADTFVHAISGLAGIPYALEASKTGKRLAIANKESIISLGDLIYYNIRKNKGELIPVDSEHSAIFQCLLTSKAISASGDFKPEIVKRILLTASGGPFFGMTKEQVEKVTPEMALAHPTWSMGQKITIDCATLMNKGFEIIEAVRLFGVDIDKIEVLVHRQSIIHSMVEYIDNMVIAQLGNPDMSSCIRYSVTYPERSFVASSGVDFTALGKLTFDRPDREVFPLLDAAVRAYKKGTTAPAALIAADEEAVSAFISGKIGFCDISDIVCETLEAFTPHLICDYDSVIDAEITSRDISSRLISNIKR